MKCLRGCLIKDDDLGAQQLDSGEYLCGDHVDDLLGRAPTPNRDTIGRVITPRHQPKRRTQFSSSLGAFPIKKRNV